MELATPCREEWHLVAFPDESFDNGVDSPCRCAPANLLSPVAAFYPAPITKGGSRKGVFAIDQIYFK
jgi:hypothetical protein